jgi:uncharacterized protein
VAEPGVAEAGASQESGPAAPPVRPGGEQPRQEPPQPATLPPQRALIAALVATVLVTVASRAVPDDWANTVVGGIFLGATWLLVLRGDTAEVRAHGLSLGGVTEPEALDPRRIAVASARALGWALLFAAIFFPPFWYGYKLMWTHGAPFVWRLPHDFGSRVLGQLLVIALPEEAFFRGFLQSSLEAGWPRPRWRILGAELGLGWLCASLIFAVGHVLTIPNAARLGVFFPALVFGWLRARTGGIGAGVAFHAMCNLFSGLLASCYGLE